jgi:hypothetical protein
MGRAAQLRTTALKSRVTPCVGTGWRPPSRATPRQGAERTPRRRKPRLKTFRAAHSHGPGHAATAKGGAVPAVFMGVTHCCAHVARPCLEPGIVRDVIVTCRGGRSVQRVRYSWAGDSSVVRRLRDMRMLGPSAAFVAGNLQSPARCRASRSLCKARRSVAPVLHSPPPTPRILTRRLFGSCVDWSSSWQTNAR